MCNNKEETTSTTLWKFLKTNTVEIPIIQRDYAQGRKGKEKLRETFLSDLKEALDNKKPLKLDFIYGSIENGVFQPLDGQQRLTTLWLLHWYIAYKAGKLSEEKETLGKFTYETRVSSREFCQKILELTANDKENVVKHIKKQTWFYSEWLQDPTIQAMLNMLGGTSIKKNKDDKIVDGLEEAFHNATVDEYKKYWELLIDDKCLQFYSLKLENFGLTDDLYIKMNARGKPLTSFENFKADVIGYIKYNEKCQNWKEKRLMNQYTEEGFKNTFVYKIDTAWTDLFWKYKSDNNKIDDAFFNFFTRYFLNYLIVNKEDSEEKIKENPLYIELYRSGANKEKIEYASFKNYETIFEEDCLESLKNTLDNIVNNIVKYPSLIKCFAPYWENSEDKKRDYYLMPQYVNDEIKGITDDGRVIFFAICRYFEQINEQEEEKLKETLKQWMRVVWNIVENSGANLVSKLRLISELSEHSHSMYDFLAKDEEIKSDFATEQIKEEREKAKKIIKEGNDWEEKIIEAEKTAFFKGAIRFLFRIGIDDDKNNIYDWSKFDARLERVKRYFDSSGVKHKDLKFEDRDFEINKSNTFLLRNFINTFNTFDHGIYWIYLSYKANDWRKILSHNEFVENINTLLDSDLQEPVIKKNEFNNSQEQLAYEDLLNVDFIAECLSFFEYGFWIRPWSGRIIVTAYNAKAEWKKYVIGSRRNNILAELEKKNDVKTDKRIYSLPYYWGSDVNFKHKGEEFVWKLNDDIVCLSSEECIFNASNIEEANEFKNKINSAIK